MRDIILSLDRFGDQVLLLGRVGENRATRVLINLKSILSQYPDAIASITVKPPGREEYPAAVKQDDGILTWEITSADIGDKAGSGQAQITIQDADGTVIKTAIACTRIGESLGDATATAPDPVKTWIDKATGMLADVERAGNAAQAVADEVQRRLDNGDFVGPQGPQGDKGETGPIGPQGPKGEKGDKGDRGEKGDTGPQGETGAKGDAFTFGDFTLEQLESLRGPKGDTGATGPQGKEGAVGPQGPQGAKGEPGKDAVIDATLTQEGEAADAKAAGEVISQLKTDLDNKIEHVGGYKEYDIGTPSVGTYWNKSAKKQLESETCQSFNPISLKAGTYHYENMSGSFTFYEDTDGNWIPIGKYSASGNGDVVITNDTTMYITEMQKSGVFVGAKLSSGDITQKESNWFKNPKYDIDNINNTLESLSDSVNDIKSIDGSAIKEYCIYVSTTGSDTSGDGSEEKPFATIYHANETITDNSYTKRYRIIVLPGTYTDLQDKYTGIAHTNKYQGVITKPWVTYESKSGNPKDTIIEWDGSTGLENPTRDDVVDKCAFHIVSLPRTFTAIKGFTVKGKNTRYAMHCESGGNGIQGEWLIENCIFDWGGCPDISDDTGKVPAIGIGMSPCEKGTIKFCKIVTTTVETMLVHDGKNTSGNSAVILGTELNFIKCDLGTGRLQFQSIYPKSGEINAKTNNVCNLVNCTQINNLYSYISKLNSDGEMVWRVYEKDCDFASYGNMSDYVYKIGTANNVSN